MREEKTYLGRESEEQIYRARSVRAKKKAKKQEIKRKTWSLAVVTV